MGRLDGSVSAEWLLRLHPTMSAKGALHQASQHLKSGDLQAAAAWTVASELLLEREMIAAGTKVA